MGHYISGIVTKRDLLQSFAKAKGLHPVSDLINGLGFLPLSGEHLDFLFPTQGSFDGAMIYLSESLKTTLAELSLEGPVAYIETEYFGGEGVQGATVYDLGKCVFGPITNAVSPISEAMHLMGVSKEITHHDIFETAGFCRHRNNEDWIDEAITIQQGDKMEQKNGKRGVCPLTCANNKMCILNQHKYRLRWWTVVAAVGVLILAIESAFDDRWVNALIFIYNSYFLMILHRYRNSSRVTMLERNKSEIVLSYADGKRDSIFRDQIESIHDTGPYLVVYTRRNQRRLSHHFKRREFDHSAWKQVLDDSVFWAIDETSAKT